MARAVRGIALAAALVACASAHAALTCQDDLAALSPQLKEQLPGAQQRVEQAPLFKAMVRAHGAATACSRKASGTGASLSWTFAGGAAFTARIDPATESERHAADLALPVEDARKLLQETERARFKPAGCGIKWADPPETSGDTLVWRGDTCNCQARISVSGGSSTKLIFSSAC